MKWIKEHFQRYRERPTWDFCWRIAIEGTIVALAVSFIIESLGVPSREIDIGFWPFLFFGVVIAPIFETLIFQAFPVWIARLCKARFSVQLLASVMPFTIVHAIEGVQTGIAAGVVSGFYLAFTYVHWREHRRWTAFWTTAVSHSIHNAIVIPLALALGEITI
jgi:hypothetical protein